MYNVFEVKDWGLKVDGKDLAPGSKLLHKGVAPTSWKSVGESVGTATDGDIKRASKSFEVATPKEIASGDGDVTEFETEDIKTIAELYEEKLGKKPHHMMKEETMLKAIEDAENG